MTAGCAALLTAVWVQGLPEAAGHDLAASPDDAVAVTRVLSADRTYRQADRNAAAAPGAAAFHRDPIEISETYTLPARHSGPAGGVVTQTFAAAGPEIRGQTQLVEGTWPEAGAGAGPIPVAVPVPVLHALGLSVGAVLTGQGTRTHAPTAFVVTGAFRFRSDAPAALSWNPAGMSGSANRRPVRALRPAGHRARGVRCRPRRGSTGHLRLPARDRAPGAHPGPGRDARRVVSAG